MNVLVENIHLVDEGVVELVVAALKLILGGRIILVDGNDFNFLERNQAGGAAASQLVIQGNGS